MSSNLEKTHAKLKADGYTYAKVEYFNPWSKTTLDLFGLHDTVAIRADVPGVFGINSCGEDISSHVNKYLKGYTRKSDGKVYGPNVCLYPWLRAGNRFSLWGWRKRGDRGKRKTWHLREIVFSISPIGNITYREVSHD